MMVISSYARKALPRFLTGQAWPNAASTHVLSRGGATRLACVHGAHRGAQHGGRARAGGARHGD
jgi:hypothetical protein